MSLLQQLVLEEISDGSVTTGGDIGSVHGSLFGGGVMYKRLPSDDVNLTPNNTKEKKKKKKKNKKSRLSRACKRISESLTASNIEQTFDPADVINKLSSAQKKATAMPKDIIGFGLEDDQGKIVKVFVSKQQANDFEQALSQLMADSIETKKTDFRYTNNDSLTDTRHSGDDSKYNVYDKSPHDDNPRMNGVEIAEVIYELKQKFDIIDVDWGTIEEDEEETQSDSNADNTTDDDSNNNGDGENTSDSDSDSDSDKMDNDDSDAKSALDKVIDVMKADAEAKQAESNARKAEANAKEAEYAAKSSAHKVKQEEQVLDMEQYNSDKRDQDKEAKKLSKLAKWQHDKAEDEEAELSESTKKTVSKENTLKVNIGKVEFEKWVDSLFNKDSTSENKVTDTNVNNSWYQFLTRNEQHQE